MTYAYYITLWVGFLPIISEHHGSVLNEGLDYRCWLGYLPRAKERRGLGLVTG